MESPDRISVMAPGTIFKWPHTSEPLSVEGEFIKEVANLTQQSPFVGHRVYLDQCN